MSKWESRKQEILELIDKGYTRKGICEEVGIPYMSLNNAMKGWGVKTNSAKGKPKTKYNKKPKGSKYDKYKDDIERMMLEGLLQFDIADQLGIARGSIPYLVAKFGLSGKNIEARGGFHTEKGIETISKTIKNARHLFPSGLAGKFKVRDQWVELFDLKHEYQFYIDQDLKLREMAELTGITRKSVQNHLKKLGLKIGYRSGTRHPNWKGGHERYRGPDWSSARKEALERDNFICQHCGVTQDEYKLTHKKGLDVHHRIPWRECKSNEVVNLITLCSSCHLKEEYQSD